MANDPHLSKNPTAPLGDADYEGAHAEATATERGRRLLMEYAVRNRHPDTHNIVSTQPSPPRAANDSLAALRALSEEEIIALFS